LITLSTLFREGQPTTINQQPSTNNHQPTTINQQRSTNHQTIKPSNQQTNKPTNHQTINQPTQFSSLFTQFSRKNWSVGAF